MYVRVPGKLSEINFKVLVFSNPGDNIKFLGKLRDRFVPLILNILGPCLLDWRTLECISDSFPGTLKYLSFLENSCDSAPMCSSSPIQGTMS